MVSISEAAAIVGMTEQTIRNEIHRNGLQLGGEQGRARDWSETDVIHLALYKALRKVEPLAVLAARTAAEIADRYEKDRRPDRYALAPGATWQPVAATATLPQIERAMGKQEFIAIVDLRDVKSAYRMFAAAAGRAG